MGFNIKTSKTKTLGNNRETVYPITVRGHIIEEVTEFTNLVVKVTKDGNSASEVKARISKARGAFVALKSIWKTNKLIIIIITIYV